MMIKKAMVVMVLAIFIILIVGCSSPNSNENENFVSKGIQNGAEIISGLFGDRVLTKDKSLVGERVFGEDNYVGTYEASYQQFSSAEYLFGGATLGTDEGKEIQITYNADIQSGEVSVLWNNDDDSGEELILFEGSGEQSETVEIKGGWEYLIIKGKELEGNIKLDIDYK